MFQNFFNKNVKKVSKKFCHVKNYSFLCKVINNEKQEIMETTDLKVGQKFESGIERKDGSIEFYGTIYTIYQITDKRVCYTDGKAHYCGSTNTLKSGLWIGIERFKKDVESGKIVFK